MTSRSESLAHDLKAWAADQLQVEPECAPPEARAAYLRQVQFDNGVPNLAAREALLILTGRNQGARPALALEAAEAKLQREVDDFGTRYFSLASAERKAEWSRLRARGQGFVRVDARLAALRVGLDITLPVFERDSPAQKLAAVVGELFVLPPAARAARRQLFLAEVNRSPSLNVWTRAASLLQANDSVAALEPELLAALAENAARAGDKQQLNRSMRKAVEPAATGNAGAHWPWGIVVMIAIALIRLFAMDRSPPRPDPNFAPAPNFNAPPKFNPDEILKNIQLRRSKENQKREPEGAPGATERLFGKDAAKQILDQAKDKPAEVPKDKRDLP